MTIKDGVDAASVEGATDMPYAIPNRRIEVHNANKTLTVLWCFESMGLGDDVDFLPKQNFRGVCVDVGNGNPLSAGKPDASSSCPWRS